MFQSQFNILFCIADQIISSENNIFQLLLRKLNIKTELEMIAVVI